MAKIPIKHLVSLIKEQIDNQGTLNQLFPPDKYVFIENITDYPQLFQPIESPRDEKIRTQQPELEPEVQPEPELEPEMVYEMAVPKFWRDNMVELETPLRIPKNMLSRSPASLAKMPELPRIVSHDPELNEFVEDVVIGTTLITTPSGHEVLEFKNYGYEQNVDQNTKYKLNYIVLADRWKVDGRLTEFTNVFMGANVRGKKYGRDIDRDVLDELLANPPGTDASEEEMNEWLDEVHTLQNARAKRYALFPLINRMFSEPTLLDKLDISLIPETWATSIRTEHTTNKTQIKKFGGTTAEIDANFISVRDLENVEGAVDEVMDLRAELALGAVDGGDENEDEETRRKREKSLSVPRRHANYIYRNGNWYAKQRVHDENFFEREGGKTPRYELFSRNIQEGKVEVTVESELEVQGKIEGNEYVMKSTFKADLNVRHPELGAGVKVTNNNEDEDNALFPPIVTGYRKPLIDEDGNPINPEEFTLEKNIEFFVNEGRTVSEARTGFLPDFFKQTGENIKNNIDPDTILDRMVELVQLAAQYNPEAEENL